MKKYLVIVSLIFTMVMLSTTSLADNNIIAAADTDNVVKIKPVIKTEPKENINVQKSKAQLKAEKKFSEAKLKANEKLAKKEAQLNKKIEKEQAKEQAKLEKQKQKDLAKEKKLQEKNAKIQQKEALKNAKAEEKAAKEQLKINQKAAKAEAKASKSEQKNKKAEVKAVKNNTPQKTVQNEKLKVEETTTIVPVAAPAVVEVKNEKVNTKTEDKTIKKTTQKQVIEQANTTIDVVEPVKIDYTESKQEVKAFFDNFAILQNKHNIAELKKLYADNFVNTDGYNKTQLFKLMKRTFESYPDLKTEFKIQQIVATNDFAMVYIKENISATTKAESKITNDKGSYNSELHDIFYLKKIGNVWTIYSENVVYESSILAHGSAKNVAAVISAPQKVLSGAEYTASAYIDIPAGYNAIGSVNSTQIVDGYNMSGETFRQFKSKDSALERVLVANDKGNNEAVVVSIGLTEITQDMFKKAKIDLSGLAILMQRVDVIPVNSNFKAAKEYQSDY